MITAFVSDIHSNLEALRAVLADVEEQAPDRIVCLGDVVNYGPDPVRCLRIARTFDLVLLGNHEEAVLYEPIGFNVHARDAATWTRKVLEPTIFSDGAKWANWNFIRALPTRSEEDSVYLVHASPRDPTGEYLLPNEADPLLGEPSEKLVNCFEMIDRLCFVGHTHLPGVFREHGPFATPEDLGGEWRVPDDGKAIINVGSVGQPRDRNPDACYAMFDGEVVRYHRVAYDREKTCEKVKAIKGLPDRGGTRLLKGE
ncbi:MAG: metallophosphoesterase family protein [bacterium]